jgi:hypothetical protein
MSSFMSVASSWGLLAHVFFLAKGFCGETFLFFDVSTSVGGLFSGVASLSPFFSPSSPPTSDLLHLLLLLVWESQVYFLSRRCRPYQSLCSKLPPFSSSSPHLSLLHDRTV